MSAVLVGLGAGLVVATATTLWRWYTARMRNPPLGWDELSMSRRRVIRRAVLKGEAVETEDARVAADLAVGLMRQLSVARRAYVACFYALGAAYWLVLAGRRHQRGYLLLAGLYAALLVFHLWRSRRIARRLQSAYVTNAELGYRPA
jgi:hypothetical protein